MKVDVFHFKPIGNGVTAMKNEKFQFIY